MGEYDTWGQRLGRATILGIAACLVWKTGEWAWADVSDDIENLGVHEQPRLTSGYIGSVATQCFLTSGDIGVTHVSQEKDQVTIYYRLEQQNAQPDLEVLRTCIVQGTSGLAVELQPEKS